MGNLLAFIILGGLMGLVGQVARVVIGLKGMSDNAKAQGLSSSDLFEAGRLVTSCLIGFAVGIAAALITFHGGDTNNIPAITWDILLAWIAAGYAGTDFLEGFISQYLPQGGAAAKAPPPTPTVQLHPASIDILTTQLAKKIPTYSQPQATTWVDAAFAVLNITNVSTDDTLGKLGQSSQDFSYLKLLGKINDQIKGSNPNNILLGTNALQKWSDSTKVSDLITMVQYAPTGSATA